MVVGCSVVTGGAGVDWFVVVLSSVPLLLQSMGVVLESGLLCWVVLLDWRCGDWYGSGETCGLMTLVRPGGVGWLLV